MLFSVINCDYIGPIIVNSDLGFDQNYFRNSITMHKICSINKLGSERVKGIS